MKQPSSYLTIQQRDLFKGLIVAVFMAVLTSLAVSIEDGKLPSANDWRNIGLVAIGAGISYIVKNFITNSKGEILTPDPKTREQLRDDFINKKLP